MVITIEEFTDQVLEVQLPFVEGGRSWDGVDCYGLLYLAFKEVRGVLLPGHTDEYSSTKRRQELMDLIAMHRAGSTEWTEVGEPQAMDGVLLTVFGRDCHIGLMLNDREFLHIEEKCMAMVEQVNQAPWRGTGYDKIEGFYRHVST